MVIRRDDRRRVSRGLPVGAATPWLWLVLLVSVRCGGEAADPESGVTVGCQIDSECDDHIACTRDRCQEGRCRHEPAPLACDDGVSCTRDACDPLKGCVSLPDREGESCDDLDPCTVASVCVSGACLGTAVDCDDGDPCTADRCEGACLHEAAPDGTGCDDGDACTSGDLCVAGACAGGQEICACRVDADCAPHEDGNPCDGTLRCSDDHLCVVDEATIVACDTSGDTACLRTACSVTEGTCETLPVHEGEACPAEEACATAASCEAGDCVVQAWRACDDGEACTEDACDPGTGECVFTPLSTETACDDGAPCTLDDACDGAGACVPGVAVTCDDGAACTSDACDPATGDCVFTPLPLGQACEDGDLCTVDDVCDGAGACAPGVVVACDDAEACTVDACEPESGACGFSPHAAGEGCDDGDACTVDDACDGAGVCAPGAPVVCDDGEGCTEDSCDPASGACVFAPRLAGEGCEDGDACTLGDACDGLGACASGPGKACDDGESCTSDACDTESGACVFTPRPAGEGCEDGDACSLDDTCDEAGACLAGAALDCDDGQDCTVDGCDPVSGCLSTNAASGADCDDHDACTVGDRCDGSGGCVSGAALTCDDGEICTANHCDALDGCVVTPRTGEPCDDGNACTTQDACDEAGACAMGVALACHDDDACTLDGCDPGSGCVFTPNPGGSCEDGDACTEGDTCTEEGVCAPGVELSCDDQQACTRDTCDPSTGCVFTPTPGEPCSDGDECTLEDACDEAGTCAPGEAVICDDQSMCTTDGCDPDTGSCVFTPLPPESACEDGDPCTVGDRCEEVACIPGPVNTCDDGEPCTTDACQPEDGRCLNEPLEDGLTCDDGELCTHHETCTAGVCGGGSSVDGCCHVDADCPEPGDCELVSCDLDAHQCQHALVSDCCGNGVVEADSDEECEPVDGQPEGLCDADCLYGRFEPPGVSGEAVSVALAPWLEEGGGLQVAFVEEVPSGAGASRRAVLARLDAAGRELAAPIVMPSPAAGEIPLYTGFDERFFQPDRVAIQAFPATAHALVPVTFVAWTLPVPEPPWEPSHLIQGYVPTGRVGLASLWGEDPWVDHVWARFDEIEHAIRARSLEGGADDHALTLAGASISPSCDASARVAWTSQDRDTNIGSQGWLDEGILVGALARLEGSKDFGAAGVASDGALVLDDVFPEGEGLGVETGLRGARWVRLGARLGLLYVRHDLLPSGEQGQSHVRLHLEDDGCQSVALDDEASIALYTQPMNGVYPFTPAAVTSADGEQARIFVPAVSQSGDDIVVDLDLWTVHPVDGAATPPVRAALTMNISDGVGLRYVAARVGPDRIALVTVRRVVLQDGAITQGHDRVSLAVVDEEGALVSPFVDLSAPGPEAITDFSVTPLGEGRLAIAWIERAAEGAGRVVMRLFAGGS